MNDYKDEFDEVLSIKEFEDWLNISGTIFVSNMKKIDKFSDASLRHWIEMFLLWCEYKENK